MNRPVGIDLGTTNSCVCVTNAAEDALIIPKDGAGGFTTPSCVWHDAVSNEIVVGAKAFRRRGSRPEPVVSIKRKMGSALLTPLGKAGSLPVNLPPGVRQALTESREARLERHLRHFIREQAGEESPAAIQAKEEQLRRKPPQMWVFDQTERLRVFLGAITDEEQRRNVAADPPLLWLPAEISAVILAEMRRQMLLTLAAQDQGMVSKAVITVPAYFGVGQNEATKEAGELAGIEVLELLHEPTAAAIYYCWKHRLPDGNFMIYDLGGGTFDVSIVRYRHESFDVVGISGDNLLGGDNMDNALAEWIRTQVTSPEYDLQLDLSSERDRCIRNRFVMLAEDAKKKLGDKSEVAITDDSTVKDRQARSVSVRLTVTRKLFDDLNRSIVEQSVPKCYEALAKAFQKAEITLKDIDRIFLVGGSTRGALVRDVVRECFCQGGGRQFSAQEQQDIVDQIKGDDAEHSRTLRRIVAEMLKREERAKCDAPLLDDPDLCVAKGAGVKAARHGTETHDDVSDLSITFIGLGPTRELQAIIKGVVGAKEMTAVPSGARVCLADAAGNTQEEADLGDGHTFVFKNVPLRERSINQFKVSVRSAQGGVIVEREVQIEQNPESKLGVVEPPEATLSKPILVEVRRGGKVQKQVLVAGNTTLPVTEEHRLMVPNPNVGMVDFRIHQDRKHLKTISAVIDPTLPPGTPISLTFTIEEDHFMRCGYRIGSDDKTQWAIIEPPAPDTVPTREETDRLCDQIDEAASMKDPIDKKALRNRLDAFKKEIQTARSSADDPKVIDLLHQLRELRDHAVEGAAPLEPPWEETEGLISYCRTLVSRLAKAKPDFPAEETGKNLDEQRNAALKLYKDGDQEAYSSACERFTGTMRGLKASLDAAEGGTGGGGPEPTDEDRRRWQRESAAKDAKEARNLVHRAEELAKRFQSDAKSSADPDIRKLAEQHERQCLEASQKLGACANALDQLQSDAMEDIGDASRKRTTITNDIQRLRGVVQYKEKILREGKHSNDGTVPITEGITQGYPKALGAIAPMFIEQSIPPEIGTVFMPETVIDRLHFSVTSPAAVVPEQTYVLDVWAHMAQQRKEVLERAFEQAADTSFRIKSEGPVHVARGTVLAVRLRIQDFTVNPPQKTILWDGEVGNASFIVTVPPHLANGSRAGTATISVNGIQVAMLSFIIQIASKAMNNGELGIREKLFRSAFASYASDDRDKVLARIQGIQKAMPQMDVFLDVAVLRSGDNWQARLRDEILKRDIFYLFWSAAANRSEWVAWEWRCALKERGIGFIDPIPLVQPDVVPPPAELGGTLHFNDWVLAYMTQNDGTASP